MRNNIEFKDIQHSSLVTAASEAYASGALSDEGYIEYLKSLEPQEMGTKPEGNQWFFASDDGLYGKNVLIRGVDFAFVIQIPLSKGEKGRRKLKINRVQLQKKLTPDLIPEGKRALAFSGTARSLTAEEEPLYVQVIDDLLRQYDPNSYIVRTGAYDRGIPRLTGEIAAGLGFFTQAIGPELVLQSLFNRGSHRYYDEVLPIGVEWGDETESYVHHLTELFFIGGGLWTLFEREAALREQKRQAKEKGRGGLGHLSQVLELNFLGEVNDQPVRGLSGRVYNESPYENRQVIERNGLVLGFAQEKLARPRLNNSLSASNTLS